MTGSVGKGLRTVLVLGRVSNLPTVWTNVMAGWFLAGEDWGGGLWWMMVGVSLLYVGGMTLNDAFDAKWDAEHANQRPIPAGAISPRRVWSLGWAQMLAGALVAFFLGGADGYCLLALVLAIVIYDWSHKRWRGAVFVMGACRFLVYLVAASAVIGKSGHLAPELSVFASGLFFYVVGITIAARGESTGGGVGWLGKVLLLAPMSAGGLYLAKEYGTMEQHLALGRMLAIAVFALWLARALWQLRSTRPDRVGRFVSALLAGIILVDLIALAQVGNVFWVISGALLLVTVLAQRWIPAT